jgi:hypothetical protein
VTLVLDGNVAASGAVRVGMRGMLFAGQWSPPCWAGAYARQAPSASIRAGVVSPTQALARCGRRRKRALAGERTRRLVLSVAAQRRRWSNSISRWLSSDAASRRAKFRAAACPA